MQHSQSWKARSAWAKEHPTNYTITQDGARLVVEQRDEYGAIMATVYTARGAQVQSEEQICVIDAVPQQWTSCEDWFDWIGGSVLAVLMCPVLGTPRSDTCRLARRLYGWLHEVAPETTAYAMECWREWLADELKN